MMSCHITLSDTLFVSSLKIQFFCLFRWAHWQLQVFSLYVITPHDNCFCPLAQVTRETETQRKRRLSEQKGQHWSQTVFVGLTLYSGWTLVSHWCLLIWLKSTTTCCGLSAAKPCGCSFICHKLDTLQEASTFKTATGGSRSYTGSFKLQRQVWW